MTDSSANAETWTLAPASAAKRLALAFAGLFGGAALFVPTLEGFSQAQSHLESIGLGLAALITALTAAFVLDLALRPAGRLLLDAAALALDPRRPQARPLPGGRLLLHYGAYGAAAVGLATLFARDAAQRAEPTFHGMVAIGIGLLFGGGLLAMAVAATSIAAGDEQPDDPGPTDPPRFGFGAALALGLCATLSVDTLCVAADARPPAEHRR